MTNWPETLRANTLFLSVITPILQPASRELILGLLISNNLKQTGNQ